MRRLEGKGPLKLGRGESSLTCIRESEARGEGEGGTGASREEGEVRGRDVDGGRGKYRGICAFVMVKGK
jgi:hypothetical protein